MKIFAKAHLKAKDRKEALRVLVEILKQEGCIKDSFWEALLDREEKFPTGLVLEGSVNVALAHTDTKHVIRSGFAVGVLEKPVQFHNMGVPDELVDVKVVFVMAAKNPKSIVPTLQRITEEILQNREVMAKIASSDTDSELQQYLERLITLKVSL